VALELEGLRWGQPEREQPERGSEPIVDRHGRVSDHSSSHPSYSTCAAQPGNDAYGW
jgi:hypothetical protein